MSQDPPLSLPRPDLSAHAAGTHGLPYLHSFAAGAEGPHAVIAALVHGNEVCGAVALDRLLRSGFRPERGRLTLVFVNIDAFLAEPPVRFLDEDLNRVWAPATLDGPGVSRELARARSLRPWLDQADFLLDLHSMHGQATPLALAGEHDKGAALARGMGLSASIVHDAGHPAGPRMRDYGRFGDAATPNAAVLLECGRHGEASAADLAWQAVLRFLCFLEMMPAKTASALAGGAPPAIPEAATGSVPPMRIRVTGLVTAGRSFRFAQPWTGMEIVPRRGTVVAWNDGEAVLTPHDDCVLVMPTPGAAPGTTALRMGRILTQT